MHDNVTDQCAHGARSEDLKLPIRKRTFLRSTIRLRSTSRACKCTTRRAELQGTDDQGRKRTALAAVYPVGLCRSLVKDMVKHMHTCRSQAYWKCKRCQHGAGS
eukprot:1508439-Pyramimonas_sp.AAC.1